MKKLFASEISKKYDPKASKLSKSVKFDYADRLIFGSCTNEEMEQCFQEYSNERTNKDVQYLKVLSPRDNNRSSLERIQSAKPKTPQSMCKFFMKSVIFAIKKLTKSI